MTTDMTKGSPVKLLLKFSIPMLIGNLFQQLYSMVDAIVVGRAMGVKALAAVGATGSMNFLVIGFAVGFASGFSIVVAQRFGAGDDEGVRQSTAMSLMLSAVVAAIGTALSVLGTKPLLRLMNTPADIFDNAYNYIVVVFAGLATIIFYNLFACVLRALGDSKTPLYFLILSSLLNVGLDLLFVVVFRMGVAGASWATVLAQGVSAVLCGAYMYKKFPILHFKKEDFKWRPKMCVQLLRIGVPTALTSSITAIGCMMIQTTINGFGSAIVAAYTAANKVEAITSQITYSLGLGVATYAAQNYGAGNYARVRSGVNKAAIMALIGGTFGAVVVWAFGTPLNLLFVAASELEVLAAARQFLFMESFFFPVLGVLFVYRSAMQGLGNATIPMVSGIVELVMRLAAAMGLSVLWGYFGVCLSNPIAWTGAAVLLIAAYFMQMRRFPTQDAPAVL